MTKPKKLPVKRECPHSFEWLNEERKIAFLSGRDDIEKEYAHGHTFIKAGEHVYIRNDIAEEQRKELYSERQIQWARERGQTEGFLRENKKKSLYRSQGIFLGVSLIGIIIIILNLL